MKPNLKGLTIAIVAMGALFLNSAQAQPLVCLGKAIAISAASRTPFVNLSFSFPQEFAPRTGWFLVDTGSNTSHLDLSLIAPDAEGKRPQPTKLVFFEDLLNPILKWNDFSHFKSGVVQSGIIGNNILARHVFTIDFNSHQLWQSDFGATCSGQELSEAGFVPISLEGYFSDNLKIRRLFPLEQVKPCNPNPKFLSVPNVPTIPVSVGGTAAIAQIDSGFNDLLYPFSVNINEELFEAVNHKEELLVPALDIPKGKLKTCVKGHWDETIPYRLKRGATFEWLSTSGLPARTYSKAIFFLKRNSEESAVCGGIGTWQVPAAQIGVSFLKEAGLTVFNARTQKMWVRKQGRH